MKKLLTYIVIIFAASIAYAQNYEMVCDPQAGVTHYKFVWSTGVEEIVPAEADGSIAYTVTNLPIGETAGELFAGRAWTLNGEFQEPMEWSEVGTPLLCNRPDVPLSPSGIGVTEKN